jgi:glutamyl-tRNA reductase
MTLLAVGLNHQTAPLALRERVAVVPERMAEALADLRSQTGVREALILSTCNRTEVYCRVDVGAEQVPLAWLHRYHDLSPAALDEFLYRHTDADAVRHLFRVATGLDSMVLGEPQILGQVKEAYQQARRAGTLRTVLDRLFQNTFAVAKRARTDTRIGANPVSVAFAAVRLAEQVFADLKGASALLIGAGDTIELVARHLAQTGVARLFVANRTLANAETLAERFDGQAVPLTDLGRHLADADLVIASTASREPLLDAAMVEAALNARRRKPMLIIDLAVPRDVAPDVAELDDVFVYTVDDLGAVVEESLRSRREAARQAEAIIELSVEHFVDWWRALEGHGPLRRLRANGSALRDEVLARARAQLKAGKPADAVLEFLAHTLTNRLLHAPSAQLRDAALRGDHELLRAE